MICTCLLNIHLIDISLLYKDQQRPTSSTLEARDIPGHSALGPPKKSGKPLRPPGWVRRREATDRPHISDWNSHFTVSQKQNELKMAPSQQNCKQYRNTQPTDI